MTVKELASFTGKDERTVQRWIKKAGDKMSAIGDKMSVAGHGKVVDYTIDEVEQILLNSSMSKDAVSILMENARQNKPVIQNQTSTLTERDVELISSIVSLTVAKTIEQLDNRMKNIENRIEERQALLPARKKDSRAHITELVRNYAFNHNMNYNNVYSLLYREYGYRTHSNPTVSAYNRHITTIEYIEQSGNIEILESIAIEMLR